MIYLFFVLFISFPSNYSISKWLFQYIISQVLHKNLMISGKDDAFPITQTDSPFTSDFYENSLI